jgi:hypothetical protein
MKLRYSAALALMGLLISGCMAGLTPDDPCRWVAVTAGDVNNCEVNRSASAQNALLADYRKCVDAHPDDPSSCSAILQGLNAYSVNTGSNQLPYQH